jgi:type I restriction enzyme S subunit
MRPKWNEHRFEDLLSEPVRNGIYKKKEFHGRGAKIVNMGELFGNPRLFSIYMKRVELMEKEIPKTLLCEGDLLFARRSLTAEGAGKCIIVKEIYEDTTFESSIIRARPDPRKVDSDYLYYFFSSPHGKYLIGSIVRQVAVAGITGSDLRQLPIPTPPLNKQKTIAHILGVLDNKIELNLKTNQTLEKMAQALFKSWFTDFDPVIDNALDAGNTIPDELKDRAERRQKQLAKPDHQPLPGDIRQLFPSEFELTEKLGWVPMGWNSIVLGDQVKPSKGKSITKSTVVDGIVPVVAGGLSPAYYHNTHNVIGPAITASASGANAGYINLYHENIWASDCSYINNNHTQFVFSTYLFLKDRQAKITLMQQGAAQPHVYPKDLMRLELVDPSSQIWNLLEDTITPYFKRIRVNELHSKSLGKARDTLLPKLISGELRLPSDALADAKQQLADATS